MVNKKIYLAQKDDNNEGVRIQQREKIRHQNRKTISGKKFRRLHTARVEIYTCRYGIVRTN